MKHSLPSPPFLLRQVGCESASEGASECCFNVLVQPVFSPLAGYPVWEGRDDDVQQPAEVLCISVPVQNSFDSHFGK